MSESRLGLRKPNKKDEDYKSSINQLEVAIC